MKASTAQKLKKLDMLAKEKRNLPRSVKNTPKPVSKPKAKPTPKKPSSQPGRCGLKGVGGVSVTPGKRLLTVLNEQLDELVEDPASGEYKTNKELIAASIIRQARAGSFAHQKELLDRENGKVPEKLITPEDHAVKVYINMPTDGIDAP